MSPARRREQIDVWHGEGDHGGADPVMLGYLFDPEAQAADRYNRGSSHVDGAWSILTGIAANESIATGRTRRRRRDARRGRDRAAPAIASDRARLADTSKSLT